MFFQRLRGRDVPQDSIQPDGDAPLRIDEARFVAWRLALGDYKPAADPPPPGRMHRGMLPDIDWSNAVSMPPRRSVLRLMAGALMARMAPLAILGGSVPRPLADTEQAPPAAVRRKDVRRTIFPPLDRAA